MPTGSAPGATKVDMLVATTRAPSKDPGILFGGERATKMTAAEIVVSIPPDRNRKVGQVQWPKKLPPNPATDFAVTDVEQIATLPEGRTWFRQHVVDSVCSISKFMGL